MTRDNENDECAAESDTQTDNAQVLKKTVIKNLYFNGFLYLTCNEHFIITIQLIQKHQNMRTSESV